MLVRPRQQGPQTSKQVKAEYKKYGPRITSQEARRLERGAELERRAEKIRETERRRKEAKRRKQEKEERNRETRKRMGISEPLPHIRASQSRLVKFMQPVESKPTNTLEREDSEIDDEATGSELDEITEEHDVELLVFDNGCVTDSERVDTGLAGSVEDGKTRTARPSPMSQKHSVEKIMDGDDFNFSDTCFEIGSQTQRELETCGETRVAKEVDSVVFEIDDFTSDTQIERELESENRTKNAEADAEFQKEPRSEASFLDGLSTQDVELSLDELEEMGVI